MDTFSTEKRSEIMRMVRGKNTKPEIAVRRHLHGRGLRFRLNRRDLPGRPDLTFASRRVAVFVHGCFWHRHEGCRRATMPAARAKFWREKFDANVKRDSKVQEELRRAGWTALVIWECEVTPEGLDGLYREIAARPVQAKTGTAAGLWKGWRQLLGRLLACLRNVGKVKSRAL